MNEQPYVSVRKDDGDIEIWLWPDREAVVVRGGHGICIGAGETRAEAFREARESLAITAKQLEHLENRG